MKLLILSFLLISSYASAALKWEPGSILNIRFVDVKHNFSIQDITYHEIDMSKLPKEVKEDLAIAKFEIEARLNVCADKVIDGKVSCVPLTSIPIEGRMDNRVLKESLGFMKTYDEVQAGIDEIMKKRGLTDKEDEKLKYYHFRLNFYKQAGKGSGKSKLIFKKKILPSRLGNGVKTYLKLQTESSKITGSGYGMIINY